MKRALIVFILFFSLSSVLAQVKDAKIIKLNCAPIDYNPKILSGPSTTSLHPDWKESEVGTSWSFFSSKKIENKEGVFLFGNLIDPKGGVMAKGCYIIFSEWDCSKR